MFISSQIVEVRAHLKQLTCYFEFNLLLPTKRVLDKICSIVSLSTSESSMLGLMLVAISLSRVYVPAFPRKISQKYICQSKNTTTVLKPMLEKAAFDKLTT